MKIIEYDRAIQEMLETSVDPETGELKLNIEALEALQMEKDKKIEGVILAYKNEEALAKSIKAEADELTARAKAHQNKANSLKEFITYVLGGDTFETSKVKVTYRKSESVEVDKDIDLSKYARRPYINKVVSYAVDKTAVKALLKAGTKIPFVQLVTKNNIQIK